MPHAIFRTKKKHEFHIYEYICALFFFVFVVFMAVIVLINVNEHGSGEHIHSPIQLGTSLTKLTAASEAIPSSSSAHAKAVPTLSQNAGDNRESSTSVWLPHARIVISNPNPNDASDVPSPLTRRAMHTLDLRAHKKVSHDTYYLGRSDHPQKAGTQVHTYAWVHYAHTHPRNQVKAGSHVAGAFGDVEPVEKAVHFNRSKALLYQGKKIETKTKSAETVTEYVRCGAAIAEGAVWKHSSGYYIHPQNSGNFDADEVVNAVEAAMDEWRCVFSNLHIEPMGALLGVVSDTTPSQALKFEKPTGSNHVAFANFHLHEGEEQYTLAITVTHGVFVGPVADRYIAEASTLFNDAHYVFSDCKKYYRECIDRGMIDLQSIATHELGHAHGLDDIYASSCVGVSMYYSANPGETNKRNTARDDILAAHAHYALQRNTPHSISRFILPSDFNITST
jgi:hypothetical protein